VSVLDFISPDRAVAENGFAPVLRSPLEHELAHAPAGVEDLSLALGKLDVSGEVAGLSLPGAEVVPVAPGRALVLCPYERTAELREQLSGRFHVVDQTGALAVLEVEGERLLLRLTDLDLSRLPATGRVAHVRTLVLRDGERFRLVFPQEYGDYLVEVVTDALKGLAS
jgi:sarcosine oxidase gamma subunit